MSLASVIVQGRQHWLAVRARAEGFLVSSNVAPSTATVSVVHNAQFAAAYGGFKHFKPMEVRGVRRDCTAAAVSTRGGAVRHVSRASCARCSTKRRVNAVMGALLLFDVSSPLSKAQRASFIGNAIELFSLTSFHGGIWRNAFTMDSIGEVVAVAYYLEKFKVQVTIPGAVLAGWVSWLVSP
jgi:hypothetical protein